MSTDAPGSGQGRGMGQTGKDAAPSVHHEDDGEHRVGARAVHYDAGWLMSVQRPALIAIMVACINLVLLAFLRRLLPEFPPGYVLFLSLMGIAAAVIGCASTAWLAQPAQRARRTTGYRLAELGLLLVVTRLAVWITTGDWPTLHAFFTRPLATSLDGTFLLAVGVVSISWIIATEMSRDLLDMSLQPDELRLLEENRRRETGQPIASNRGLLLNSFVGRWIVGGVIIVILAAGARVQLADNGFFAVTRQNVPAMVIFSIVIYFLAGLILISQGRLAILRARWTIEKTPDRSTVSRNWPIYVFAVVTVVGLLAAFMPFGGTYYLALIVATLMSIIYSVLFFVFQVLSTAFLLLLSLLPFSSNQEAAPQQAAQPMIPPAPTTPPPEFLEWAGGAIFWIMALVIVGYLAVIYFTDKGTNLGWLRRLWEMLRVRWLALRSAFTSWQVGRLRSESHGGRDGERRGFWHRFRPDRHRYSPEARVRYLYLSLLATAESVGLARRSAETPFRYAPRLQADLAEPDGMEGPVVPDAAETVEQLTGAFVDVRYAHQGPSEESVARLEAAWEALRPRLRRRVRHTSSASSDLESEQDPNA